MSPEEHHINRQSYSSQNRHKSFLFATQKRWPTHLSSCFIPLGVLSIAYNGVASLSMTPTSSVYHSHFFSLPLPLLQSTTPTSSVYHSHIFSLPLPLLQSTTPTSSVYHSHFFSLPLPHLQSTTPTSSVYHSHFFSLPLPLL